MRRYQLVALAVAASFALGLHGCGGGETPTEPPQPKSTAAAPSASPAKSAPATSNGKTAKSTPADQAAADKQAAEDKAFTNELAHLVNSAKDHEQRGYFEAAVDARKQTIELLEKKYGPDAWQTRNAKLALVHARKLADFSPQQHRTRIQAEEQLETAKQLAQEAKVEESLAAFDQAVALNRQLFGDKSHLVVNLLEQRARLDIQLGKTELAEKQLLKLIELRTELGGEEHPNTARAREQLGVLYQGQGRLDDAQPLLEQAVKTNASCWGPSTAYATSANHLGMLYFRQGKNEPAAKLLLQSATLRKRLLGPKHLLYGQSLSNLGTVFFSAGKFDSAAKVFDETLLIYAQNGQSDSVPAVYALHSLGMSYAYLKDLGRAESLLAKCAEQQAKVLGAKHADRGKCLYRLGRVYGAQEKFESAERVLREALALQEEVAGANSSDVRDTLVSLAEVCRRTEREDEASALTQRAEGITAQMANTPAGSDTPRRQ